MTEERRRRIRKKRKMARLRARRRKLILSMIVCALLIVAVVTGIVKCAAGEDDKKAVIKTEEQNNKDTKAKREDSEEKEQTQDKESEEDEEKSGDDKKEPEQDPRVTEFAVDPARLPGSDVSTDEKVVYLTFDDGPSELTPKVMEILDKYDAKATFFVTNHSMAHANLIKEAHDKGHTIGMHTSSHDYNQLYSSVEAYFADLDAIAQTVKTQIGYVPCFIRFPGGSSNAVSAPGIMDVLIQEVQARGYQYYDWNVSAQDGTGVSKEEIIANSTTEGINNILYLAHDSGLKQSTVDALPTIIEYYKNQGYVFKALDRNTITSHHR